MCGPLAGTMKGPQDTVVIPVPPVGGKAVSRLNQSESKRGFVPAWLLSVVHGSSAVVGLTDVAIAASPAGGYPGAVVDSRSFGTSKRSYADISGCVTIIVTPPLSRIRAAGEHRISSLCASGTSVTLGRADTAPTST